MTEKVNLNCVPCYAGDPVPNYLQLTRILQDFADRLHKLENLAQATVDVPSPSSGEENLWQMMEKAYFEGRNPGYNDRHGYANEIRAIRDFIKDWAPGDTVPLSKLYEMLSQQAAIAEAPPNS